MRSNNTLKLDLIRLRSEGCSYKQIADELGLSKPTIIKWSRELAVEISNQKKLEYESFLFSLDVTRKNRIKKLKIISDKLESELEKRDFSDLPTSKLIEQLLKVYECLDRDVGEISFEAKSAIDFSCLDQDFYDADESG